MGVRMCCSRSQAAESSSIVIFFLSLNYLTDLPWACCKLSAIPQHSMSQVPYIPHTSHTHTSKNDNKEAYIGVGWLGGTVMNSRTIDTRIVHAGQHEHLFVVLITHHAGQDFFVWHLFWFFFCFFELFICNKLQYYELITKQARVLSVSDGRQF